MKNLHFTFLFTIWVFSARSQSATIYLCNDCTYSSSVDGQTITFLNDGRVKINGQIKANFSCFNNDGVIVLKYKGKIINHLSWYRANYQSSRGYSLIDDRGVGYTLLKCTGNMPPIQQLMKPTSPVKAR